MHFQIIGDITDIETFALVARFANYRACESSTAVDGGGNVKVTPGFG